MSGASVSEFGLWDLNLLQTCFDVLLHSIRGRSPGFPIDKDMNELSHRLDVFHSSFEEADLIGHRTLSEFVHPQSQFSHSRKRNGAKEIPVGMDN